MNRVNTLLVFCVLLFLSTKASAQLTANFGATPVSGCSPFVVQFTDSSTGGAVSWVWDLGNGTTSTLQSPSKTYTTAGTNSITLTVTDSAGNTSVKTRTGLITVIAKPEISFSSPDTLPGCAPKTVSFTSQVINGVPGALTYTWDFGDGSLSNAANPTHTYVSAGNFDVTLSVTNAQGCNRALTKIAYIKTNTKPQSGFSFLGNSACTLPMTVNFANSTVGSLLTAYQWNFGNGQTSTLVNPTATYSTAGTYAVRLISTSPGGGCVDTLVQNVVVSTAGPAAGFTAPVSGCAGTAVSFTNTSTPGTTTAAWTFGDGTGSTALSPSKIYTTAGTYTVRLIARSGNNCNDTLTKTITINPAPIASFTTSPSPVTGCSVPKTFTFTNTSAGAVSYSWTFGDGTGSTTTSPSKTYTGFGTYNITLTAIGGNGCAATSASVTATLAAPTLSVNAAYPAGKCVPAGVSFSNSFSAVDAGTTYSWAFGDGTTGTSASPAHTYTTAGSYTVTLTAISGSGCMATATMVVKVGSRPTAAFTAFPLTVCTNVPVAFTSTATGGLTYSWKFGDGGTSTAANPSYSYGAQGVYSVTLVVSNNGCTDTLVRNNYVTVTGPIAQFTDNFLCTSKAVHNFTNTSVNATSYAWDFGDGTTSTATSPWHTYATSGSFDVQLKAFSGACTSVISKRVYIYTLNPQFTGTPLPVCKGQAVNFTLQNPAHMYSAAWNFGDGTGVPAGTPVPVSKIYSTAGTYTVTLYATDSAGCTDTLIKPAYVQVRGFFMGFKALPLSGCPGTPITFTDTSTATAGGTITARRWSFGDGTALTTGNTVSPVKTYTAAGTYGVKLVVTGSFGCSDSLLKPAYISISRPQANFISTTSAVCQGTSVAFANTSVGATSYAWSFGDGTTSTFPNPVKVYTISGNYSVRLIATGAAGCSDTFTALLPLVLPVPLSRFTVSDSVASCPPLAVQFNVPSNPGVTYFWKFGNGATATAANPSTLYTTAGTYTAKLIATSTTGCKDSSTKIIQINGPTGTLSYTNPVGCAPLAVTFTVNNPTSTVSYTFDFDNGTTITTTSPTATNFYNAGGIFKTTVILSNGAGCNILIEASDTLRVSSLKAAYSASANSVCLGKAVQFSDTSVSIAGGPLTRLWTFGDGTTSTLANPSKTYTVPGTYSVKLRLSNTKCADSITKLITVLPVPVQQVSANDTICLGEPSILTASGANTYLWSPGSSLSCTTCPNPVATPATTTLYMVVGTAVNGCTDTDRVTVVVAADPVVSAGPDKTICAGTGTPLVATGAAGYTWSPAAGLSCSSCPNPVASPAATTTYIVTGTNAAGCSTQDTVVVTVVPALVLTTNSPAQTICAGGSVGLTVSGASIYNWSPATGLSCTTCSNPTASPLTTTTYTVTGNNVGGCPGTSTITVTVKPVPPVSVLPNPAAFCAGGSVALTASGAASYSWSPATGLNCTNCPNPTASPAGTTTYTVVGTGANGCTTTVTVPVTVNPIPVVTAAVSDSVPCVGTPVILTGSGAATYVWSPSAGLSCTACPSPAATPAGTTTYTVVGTTAAGCTATAQVTIAPKPVPVLLVRDTAICAGGSASLRVAGAVSYVWSPATGLSCTTCANPIATPTVTTVYTVIGTGANGCTTTQKVSVVVNPIPVIDAGPNREVCIGARTSLNATGAATYEWSPATGLSCTRCPSPTATLTNTTLYTITGTSSAGCVGSTTLLLPVIPRSPVTLTKPPPICEGESVQLIATGGSSYSWSPAGSLSNANAADPVASPKETTTYTVIIKQGNCYVDTLSAKVVVNPLPTVNAGADRMLIAGRSTQLIATGTDINTYKWTPGVTLSCDSCSSTSATPVETTVYTITVRTKEGCAASDDVKLSVQCDKEQMYLPNTFTPNGDGTNDVFYPRGTGIRQVRSFRVYSRWGELLYAAENFSLNDETKGWNGTFNNVPLKPDVYVWVVDAYCDTGELLQRKGDIALVK